MKSSKSRIAVLLTLVLAFVCSIVLSVFSFAMAEVTPATLADVSIYTRGSAAVRIPDSEKPEETMGLRFTAVMKKDQYEALQANVGENVEEGDNYAYKAVSFGLVILPKDYADIVPVTEASLFGQGGEKRYQWTNKDNDTENQAYIINFETPTLSNLADYNELSDIDVVGFHGSIVNIRNGVNNDKGVNNIDREFISVSYIAVTAQDDTVTYKLATETILPNEEPVEGQLVRTVAEVAYQTIKDDTNDVSVENKALMQAHYLDMLKYDVVVKDGEEVVSTQKVSYGADVDFNGVFSNREIAYKIREAFVGLKDGENVVTKIAKVTSNKELTAQYGEEEVVIQDATDGIKNFKNYAGANNSAWEGLITTSTDVVYGGEDASTKFAFTSTGAATDYTFNTYIERYVPMDFESWGFKFKVEVSYQDGNAFSTTLTLGSGNGDGQYTFPNMDTNWHEVKVVTKSRTSPRTFDMYVDGSETPISGTYGGTFTPFTIKLSAWTETEKDIALYLSDIVGYTAEGKKAIVFNNGGLDDVGMLDVYTMVSEGTSYSYEDLLLNVASTRKTRTTTSGSSTAMVRDILMSSNTQEVVGYKVNGETLYKNETLVVDKNLSIEPIYGDAIVMSNFDTATLIDENGTADGNDYIQDESGKKIFDKSNNYNTEITIEPRAFRDQTNMLKIYRPADDYKAIRIRAGVSAWYNYDAIVYRFEWDALASATAFYDGTSSVSAPAGSTGCTVFVDVTSKGNYAGDIYIKFSTETKFVKRGSISSSPNYISMTLRGTDTTWYLSNVYALNYLTAPQA